MSFEPKTPRDMPMQGDSFARAMKEPVSWWRRIRMVTTFSTLVLVAIAAVLVIGELLPRYMNGPPAPRPETGRAASILNPPAEPVEPVRPFSEILGDITANLEEAALRNQMMLQGEMQARLAAVEAILRQRDILFEKEMEGRLMQLEKRMGEISRANMPNVLGAVVLEAACLLGSSGSCLPAETAPEQIVAFFDRQVMRNPDFYVLFNDDELKRAIGYNPDTGEWASGSDLFLQE